MADPTYPATQNVGSTYIAMEDVDLPDAPRFLFIRLSLEAAQLQDKGLRRLAKSSGPADNQQAVAILQAGATAAPEKEPTPSRWDPPNASFWWLHTQADSRAFIYTPEELYIATVFCAAELHVS